MPVHIVDHPLVQDALIDLRDKRTLPDHFRRAATRISVLLAAEALREVATTPITIDTPLGRLDSVHRKHLVERYFPYASNQVLLLSTDEEINESQLERLRPFIGRSYRLDYDDKRDATTVSAGYFW